MVTELPAFNNVIPGAEWVGGTIPISPSPSSAIEAPGRTRWRRHRRPPWTIPKPTTNSLTTSSPVGRPPQLSGPRPLDLFAYK